MVPTVGSDASRLPTASPQVEIPSVSPIRPSSSSSLVGVPPPDGMASIRRRFETAGFSPDVVQILLSSWGESTQKRYAGPWRAWAEWCTIRGWCPLSAPVTAVLSFLTTLLKERNLEYRTIAVYKSAISQTHDPVGSVTLGQLPVVSRFMKGVFKAKPPKPKYCCTWSVSHVLNFYRNQGPLEKISLKMLTFKVTILLALASAARAHELAALDLDYSLAKEESWEFTIHKVPRLLQLQAQDCQLNSFLKRQTGVQLRCLKNTTTDVQTRVSLQKLSWTVARCVIH